MTNPDSTNLNTCPTIARAEANRKMGNTPFQSTKNSWKTSETTNIVGQDQFGLRCLLLRSPSRHSSQ